MRSRARGERISVPEVEILNVSPRAIWIAVGQREFMMPSELFPWFRGATIAQISRVELRWDHSLSGQKTWGGVDTDSEPDRRNEWLLAANIIYKF